jgi:hypothetical protein
MTTEPEEAEAVSPFARLNSGLLPVKRAVSRAIRSQIPRFAYFVWTWRNPGKTFKDFYAESVTAALEGKKQHASLGPVLKVGRSETARRIFKQLLAQGIAPTDTLVDFGCGTLRIGRTLIEFLEPDRYIGMDIDQRILDAGRGSLPAELIASKRPALEVISPESLSRAAAKQPKWIFAKGVLQHVPPAEHNEFFGNLAPIVHAGAVGFLYGHCAQKSTALSSKSWRHDFRQLQESAALHGMELGRSPISRRVLKLQALGAALLSVAQFSAPDLAGVVSMSF